MTPEQLAELKENVDLRKRFAKKIAHDCFRDTKKLEDMHAADKITALATKRLEAMRAAQPTGVHLGAYGWVENLMPRPPAESVALPEGGAAARQPGNGGFVHAPSLAHAAAAA